MDEIIQTASACKPGDDQMRQFLLAALHCGRLRASLMANQIEAVGIALAHEMVSLNTAFDWLDEIGAWEFLDPEIGKEGVPV